MQIKPPIKLIVLISVFFLQFLSLVVYINNLASLARNVSGLNAEINEEKKSRNDYYNKEIKDIKQELTYSNDDYNLERIGSYVSFEEVKVNNFEFKDSVEGSNRSFIAR